MKPASCQAKYKSCILTLVENRCQKDIYIKKMKSHQPNHWHDRM